MIRRPEIGSNRIRESDRDKIYAYPHYTVFDWLIVKSQGGSLLVSGKVTQLFKKYDIGELLAEIDGVETFHNRIDVLPASQFDHCLRTAIALAIYRDPFFVAYATSPVPPFHIVVENGNVTLDGVVGSPSERAQAGEDARFAETFFSLTNELRIEDR